MEEREKIIENLNQELKRGTLVLSVLFNTTNKCYGYSLVNDLNREGIEIEQNTLYPLLRRLDKQGLLESFWDTSDNRPRKYYQISSLGVEVRERLYSSWVKTNSIIESFSKREGKNGNN